MQMRKSLFGLVMAVIATPAMAQSVAPAAKPATPAKPAPAAAKPAAPKSQARLPEDSDARIIPVSTRTARSQHQRITTSTSKATIIQLDTDARDALVSNPEIVDAVVRSPRRIYLLAAKTGQTNVFFFDAQGRQILSIDITVEKDTTDLAALMRAGLPNSAIQVASVNDTVVLSGNVASAPEAARAVEIAAGFAGDPKKVVNMLRVMGAQQVMLRVRVSEMRRQIAKQLGANFAGAQTVAGVPIALSTDNQFSLMGRALSDLSGANVGQVCSNNANPLNTCVPGPNNIEGTFKALERLGLLHTLAEPNMTAVSGETAKFLAGGEFPVPAGRDQQGNISIQFKPFGVGLSFTPVVLSDGRISVQVSTEVSELTNTGSFTLNGGSVVTGNGQVVNTPGLTIPALAVRRAETTVEMPSGGAFAIAGLMQHTTKQMVDAFPGVKDLPVLGALFRSRDFQNDETELVVTVSAYLVNPTAEARLALPSDGYVPASDPEAILLGRPNAVYSKDAPSQTPQAQAGAGFVVR